jgi:hypothetical protein
MLTHNPLTHKRLQLFSPSVLIGSDAVRALLQTRARREPITPFNCAAVSAGSPFPLDGMQPCVVQFSVNNQRNWMPTKPAMPFRQRRWLDEFTASPTTPATSQYSPAIPRAPSLLSNFAADYRRASEAISIMHKSWKPSRRDGSGLYRLVGDFVSEDLLVSLVGKRGRETLRYCFPKIQ